MWSSFDRLLGLGLFSFQCIAQVAAVPSGSCQAVTHDKLEPMPNDFSTVPDEYLVAFVANHSLQQHLQFLGLSGNSSDAHFEPLLMANGYIGYYGDAMLTKVLEDPGVDYVERNVVGYIPEPEFVNVNSTSTNSTSDSVSKRDTTQQNAPWHLHQVSEEFKDSPGSDYDYYMEASGINVNVYVLDTGFQEVGIPELRAASGQPVLIDLSGKHDESPDPTDRDGHGTGVASMVTGAYSGVAKNAHLISIKVCRKRDNCDRVNVIRGLLWAQWNEKNRRDKAAPHSRGGAVVNMSLQVGATKTMSDLIDKLFTQNIPVFAAAGNSGGLGEDNYPCKHPLVNCVGATTEDYNRWKGAKRPGGSASGGKVMFVAPGGGIIATWPKELKGTNHEGFCKDKPCMEASGTSFASPVAAGVAAMILSYEGRLNHLSSFTPASVFGRLKENARTGITEGWRGGGEKYFINNGFHKGHNGEPYYMPPQP